MQKNGIFRILYSLPESGMIEAQPDRLNCEGGFEKMDKKRFVELYSQGSITNYRILLDTLTGVQYLYVSAGYGAGLTPLLGADGKPVVGLPANGPDQL